MIVAGDPSGDIHGAALAEALRRRRPGVRLVGMGGPRMREAGVRLMFNLSALSTVGVVEALRNIPVLRRLLARVAEFLESQRPDVLVLIDYPGFNLKLAEIAHERNIPVVYYFSPTAWAWGKGRAQQVARTVSRVCAVLPMEDAVYREAGANVTYVGHPLVDVVGAPRGSEELRAELGFTGVSPLVALLPGSREQELRHMLPVMLRAAELFHESVPTARFAVAVAHMFRADELEQSALTDRRRRDHPAWPRWVEGRTYDLLAAADLAIITCGTATLEAALIGTPMVAVYKVSPSTYMLGKMLVKIPFVAMPNILAGRRVVPELIQSDATPARIAAEALTLWRDPAARERMKAAYDEIRRQLGGPGAVDRAAAVVLEVGETA